MSARTMAEIGKGYLHALRAPPLVKMDRQTYVFLSNSRAIYDCKPMDAGDVLRMIGDLATRSWVTKAHLEQFASLAADQFGSGYR
jgi:hypothetical protein